MHWAGGLTFTDWNLSQAEWSRMVARVKRVINDTDAIYIPGNHDLSNWTTHRWNQAFGTYNREVILFPNVTAHLSSSMAPRAYNHSVVLAHYPIETVHDPLWHRKLELALNGHNHFIERRVFNNTRQYTLPTLNPFQSTSNNHFDGSGQQGFALLDSELNVRMCQVYYFWK